MYLSASYFCHSIHQSGAIWVCFLWISACLILPLYFAPCVFPAYLVDLGCRSVLFFSASCFSCLLPCFAVFLFFWLSPAVLLCLSLFSGFLFNAFLISCFSLGEYFIKFMNDRLSLKFSSQCCVFIYLHFFLCFLRYLGSFIHRQHLICRIPKWFVISS